MIATRESIHDTAPYLRVTEATRTGRPFHPEYESVPRSIRVQSLSAAPPRTLPHEAKDAPSDARSAALDAAMAKRRRRPIP